MSTLDETIRTLHRERPRNHRLRVGGAAIAALVTYAWSSSDIQISDAFSGRRLVNAQRFVGDVVPFPLRDGAFSWQGLLDWTTRLLSDGGAEAVSATLAIAIAAAVFAAIAGALVAPFAAANIATPAPFAETLLQPSRLRFGLARIWRANIRAFLIFLRAIPEYVWAFLWIAMFGFTAWPAVLALAIHNTGILGKLDAEVLENADATAAVGPRRVGAGRAQNLTEAGLPPLPTRFVV
jgi:phosphonate transport system permease protein